MQAALSDRYPYKSDFTIQKSAERSLQECVSAWLSYEAGASAALFDLSAFIRVHKLPLPIELGDELDFLTMAALKNDGFGVRGPGKHRLGTHRLALIRRLRYEHVAAIIRDAESDKHEENIFAERGYSLEKIELIHAERTSASEVIRQAVEISKPLMPPVTKARNVTSEAVYRDYIDIRKTLDSDELWPGLYYLPSAQICENVGWEDLSAAFLAAAVPTNAPRAYVP